VRPKARTRVPAASSRRSATSVASWFAARLLISTRNSSRRSGRQCFRKFHSRSLSAAQRHAQPLCDLAQKLVSGLVAERVVDHFESIESPGIVRRRDDGLLPCTVQPLAAASMNRKRFARPFSVSRRAASACCFSNALRSEMSCTIDQTTSCPYASVRQTSDVSYRIAAAILTHIFPL